MQEGVCLDECMFVLMQGRVEDEQGSEMTSEREGGEVGRQTEGCGGAWLNKKWLIRAPCSQL